MTEQPERPNVFFRLAMFSGALFIVTVLALLATVVSDPRSPAVQFLDAHGGKLIAVEVAATIVFGIAAMAVDRSGIRRDRGHESQGTGAGGAADEENRS